MHMDLVAKRVRSTADQPHIVKQHISALPKNFAFMQQFSLRPVGLVKTWLTTCVSTSLTSAPLSPRSTSPT